MEIGNGKAGQIYTSEGWVDPPGSVSAVVRWQDGTRVVDLYFMSRMEQWGYDWKVTWPFEYLFPTTQTSTEGKADGQD